MLRLLIRNQLPFRHRPAKVAVDLSHLEKTSDENETMVVAGEIAAQSTRMSPLSGCDRLKEDVATVERMSRTVRV